MLHLDECGELDVSGDDGRTGTQISELFDLIDDGGASDGLGYGVWPALGTTTTTRSPGLRRLASFDGAMIMDGVMSPQDSTTQRQQSQMNTPKPPTAARRPRLRGARSMSSIQMSPFQMGKGLGLNLSTNATGYCPPGAIARRTSTTNLADDHHGHARTRLWPAPARAATRIPALSGSVQIPAVPQISDHYNGLQDSREGEGNGSKSAVEAREAAATVVAAAARIADEEERDGKGLENGISGTRGKFADISSAPGTSPEMDNSSALTPSARTTSASPVAGDDITLTPSSSSSSASSSSSSGSQLRLLQNTRHGLGLDQNTCIDLESKVIGVSGPDQRPPLLQEQKYERHPCDAPASSSSISGLVDTVSPSCNSSTSTSIAPGFRTTTGISTTLNSHFLHPASSDIQTLYNSTTRPPHHTQPQTIGHSSSLSLVQRRLLRRQKSRDLSTVRKTLSTDTLRTRKMERPRADVVLEDFPGESPDYMDYMPSPSSQEHQQYMISTPLSLSSESLHQQYAFPPHQQQQPDLQPTPHLTPSTHANSEWQTTYPATQNWWENTTTRAEEAESYNIYDSPAFYQQHYHHNINIKSPSVPSPPDSPGFTLSALPTPDLSFSSFDTPYHYTHAPQTPPSRPPSQGRQQHHQQPTKKPARTTRRKQSCASIRDEAAGSAFVNFTPRDASKILNGVAPSGSSKTKARREREAAERRRKLSEAAQAAVRAVGGDVGALEGVELL